MKKVHFSKGLESINAIIIRTCAVHTPEALIWDEGQASMPEPDQLTQLDPTNPNTYRTSCHWPEPLPVDQLIKLNEEQAKMALGMQSKRGAMREMGEEFPNEKMAEIYEELRDDAFDQGALDMISAQIAAAVMAMTGVVPADGSHQPAEVSSAGGEDVSTAGGPLPGTSVHVDDDVVNNLVQRAYGGNLAQRRVPEES